jgi:rare lipoprotein A
MRRQTTLGAALATALLAGCSSLPPDEPEDGPGVPVHELDLASIPDAVPRVEPLSRYGNPESYVVFGERYTVMETAAGFTERGIASWYGRKFHGRRTSSGEPYDMYKMTAAHKHLPLPTYVEVTHLENGRSVVVKVNDRGPFAHNRIIDLSYAAAAKLGMIEEGTAPVEIRVISPAGARPTAVTASLDSAPQGVSDTAARVSYFVQVGAFAEQDNARRLVRRLEAASLSTPIRLQDGERLYRVQLGPLSSVQQVDRVSQSLTEAGFTDTHVVVE